MQNMYTVYVLKSISHDRYYVGYTNDLSQRLAKHNSGGTKSTKPYRPWQVVFTEVYATKREAWLRERGIKSYKGGEAFKKLIHGGVA